MDVSKLSASDADAVVSEEDGQEVMLGYEGVKFRLEGASKV